MNWNKDSTSTNQTFLAAGFCKNTFKQVLTTPSTPVSVKSSINRSHSPRTQLCLSQAEDSYSISSFTTCKLLQILGHSWHPLLYSFFHLQHMKRYATSSQFQRLTCALAPTTAAKPGSEGSFSTFQKALTITWLTLTHRKSPIHFNKTTSMMQDYSLEDCLPAGPEVLTQSILPQNILSLNSY